MRFVAVLLTLLVGCSSGSNGSDGAADAGGAGDRSRSELTPFPDGPRIDWPKASDIDPSKPLNAAQPASTVKLVFVHHSVGEIWGTPAPEGGDLRTQLNQNNYYVRDTNYGWGPDDVDASEGTIGDHTDIGQWAHWFLGAHRDTYLAALYSTDHLTDVLGDDTMADPGGPHRVVIFKSCFLSAQLLHGKPGDAPAAAGSSNPIYGQDHNEDGAYTDANIKGLYRDLLTYFATKPDTLFVLATTPPSKESETNADSAAILRDINTWLVHHWLESYPLHNVAVFDFYTVLTGSHHRLASGKVEHVVGSNNFNAYPSDDSHPTAAGTQAATAEFLPLLNVAYHCWKGDGGCPSLMGRP
jgi:hypothetical protein